MDEWKKRDWGSVNRHTTGRYRSDACEVTNTFEPIASCDGIDSPVNACMRRSPRLHFNVRTRFVQDPCPMKHFCRQRPFQAATQMPPERKVGAAARLRLDA